MTVYTDGVHMIASTEEELHRFAAGIGMKRSWYQKAGTLHAHYDLLGGRPAIAVRMGAVLLTPRQFIHKLWEIRGRPPGSQGE